MCHFIFSYFCDHRHCWHNAVLICWRHLPPPPPPVAYGSVVTSPHFASIGSVVTTERVTVYVHNVQSLLNSHLLWIPLLATLIVITLSVWLNHISESKNRV